MCYFLLYRYHLNDVVVGKIHFLLVGLKITYMEVQLLRNEVVGSGTEIFCFFLCYIVSVLLLRCCFPFLKLSYIILCKYYNFIFLAL